MATVIYAYKKRGFFSGIIGIVAENKAGSMMPYRLEYASGSVVGFYSMDEVVLVEDYTSKSALKRTNESKKCTD